MNRGVQVLRSLDAHALDSHGLCHVGEVGILEIDVGIEKAECLHLHFHEAQGAVVQHDDLHRQLRLQQRHELAHHHGEAAIAGKRDHLALGEGGLRANAPGAWRSPSIHGGTNRGAGVAVHLQVARRPGDRRADVAREDRVVVGQLAHDPVQVLRMDDLAVGSAFRQGIEVGARLAIVGERLVEMLGIGLLGDERKQCRRPCR